MSYSLGFNRYHDVRVGESFEGDFDHVTLHAYGQYRFTDRFSLSRQLRAGSNVPATGYWEQRDPELFRQRHGNGLRLPAYSRLDLRASHVQTGARTGITLFVEVMNALGRDNVRFKFALRESPDGQAFGLSNP